MIVDAALVGLAWWLVSAPLSDDAGDGGRCIIAINTGDGDGDRDGDRHCCWW